MLGSIVRQVAQVVVLIGEPFGNFEAGQQNVAFQGELLGLLYDLEGVGDGLGQVVKQGLHFVFRLEVVLVVGEAEAVAAAAALRHRQAVAVLDAQQGVVGAGVFFIQVIGTVGGNHLHAVLLGKAQHNFVDAVLFGQAVALQFHVEVIAKGIDPPLKGFFSLVLAHVEDQVGNFTGQTAGGGDQILSILLNEFFVDPRIAAVGTFDVAPRAELRQVMVARLVFGQQQLDGAVVTEVFGEFLLMAVGHHIHVAADNHPQALPPSLGHRLEGSEQATKIGHRHGGHILCFGGGDEFFQADGALQNRKLRVYVQVTERSGFDIRRGHGGHRHSRRLLNGRRVGNGGGIFQVRTLVADVFRSHLGSVGRDNPVLDQGRRSSARWRPRRKPSCVPRRSARQRVFRIIRIG